MATKSLLQVLGMGPTAPRKPTDPYTSDSYLSSLTSDGRATQSLLMSGNKDYRQRLLRSPEYGGQTMTEASYQKLRGDLENPLYMREAEKLGIKKFSSANDVARVIESLTGGAGKRGAGAEAGKPKTPEAEPAENEVTKQLRQVVEKQIKQNQSDQQLYMGLMNDLTARITAAEQSKLNPESGYGVQVGAPGTNETAAPDVSTTTTKAIARRKKPGLEISSGEATGVSLAI